MILVVTDQAKKDLSRLDKSTRTRVGQALNLMMARPKAADLKKLEGYQDLWRLRVGEYRVILQFTPVLDDKEPTGKKEVITVYALRVINRREAYRRL
jgi:mRNA interferase RelE/StbE